LLASPRERRSEALTETAFGALLIILAGAVARHYRVIRVEDGPLLVRVVIYLAMPALILLILVRAELDGALLLVPVAGIVIHLLLLGLAWASTMLWGMERPRAGALMVATAVGNTGFFGLPLIAASGDGFSLPAAVMYDALATGLITWTSTVAVATAYGRVEEGPRVSLGDLGRALILPPNWALVAGLALNLSGVGDLPVLVERPLELLAAAVLPLTMVYAGLMIELRGLPRLWGEVSYAVIVRLGIATVVGLGVATLLGLEGEIFNTVVIMAAMPTAMMSLVIGARSGLRADVIAGAVVVSTLLSTATLPAWRAVLL
jgi:malate permease and related proteins